MTPPSSRLLIGERDPFMQRSLKRVLDAHYRLTIIDNGLALLEQAVQHPPDLILLEALLPGMDGFQVLRALRQADATAHLPVVMFSWLLAEDRARQAGADAFLLNPLHPSRLLRTIRRLLGESPGVPDE